MSRKAVVVRALSYGASMSRNASVFLVAMAALLVPEGLAALGESVDDDVERSGGHAGIQPIRRNAALAQREVVGEHLDARARDSVEHAGVRTAPRGEHTVLDQEQDHGLPAPRETGGQIIEVGGDVARFERVSGLDQQIASHRAVPPWKVGSARTLLVHGRECR